MTSAMAPEVLANPLQVVVDLVAVHEADLDQAAIEATCAALAGGRAKQRRLAQALLDNPDVLLHGRSPAPRAIGDLLLALRRIGAQRVSPPICAGCGRTLRNLQRRGEHWYCAPCVKPPHRACASCGQTKAVITVDRGGQPRCKQCPDDADRDPLVVLADVVAQLDASLPAEAVAAAALRVFTRPARLRQLAWAVEDNPKLLSSQGADAPLMGVLGLIDELIEAGAQAIIRPVCPGCDRVIRLHRQINGRWHCRKCVAKSRARPCARCGDVREAAARDEHGRPLCPTCYVSEPANLETCTGCGRRRRVGIRTPEGPLCESCRPWKTVTCTICGRQGPGLISKTTGQPWCRACKQRWITCTGCGETARLRGGTLAEPLCSTCVRPDADFWRSCPTCGQPGRIQAGRCAQCTCNRRLRGLLVDEDGQIPEHLQAFYQTVTATSRPSTVESWLNRSTTPAILSELRTRGELTHETLDALPPGKPVEHLRSVFVAAGALPRRDEQMSRLERWMTQVIAERPDPAHQQLLHSYGLWHLLRRLRRRVEGTETTHNQLATARQHLRGAMAFLDWPAAHDLALATCGQPDLDRWLTDDNATHRDEAGHFVRWAKKQKLTQLTYPAVRWGGPTRVLDTETRWEQARWLLHDPSVKPEDRVASLLILLYAQWPSTISRLTVEHVEHHDHEVRLRLGREPVILPEPLAGLTLRLVASRRGHAAIGDKGASPWLFPGGQPGRPISSYQLGQRVRQLGLQPGQARSTALFQLATDLPAAVLAKMLGIHLGVAVAWQRASSGDWATYAAEVSRRPERT